MTLQWGTLVEKYKTLHDLVNLKKKIIAKINLGIDYPLFVESQDDIEDSKGNKRYWINPIKNKDNELYMCAVDGMRSIEYYLLCRKHKI